LRLVSFLYFRWRCSARFARTSIFLHLHSWASAAAPAFPRPAHHFAPVPSSSYLPPRLHGFMHTTTFSPPTTLCAARSIRMCVDLWMCCMDFVAMCVSGVYSGGEEDSTKVRGVSERASHRSRFLLGIVLLLLALHLLLLYWRGTSAGQGRDARGGMAARGRS
jgi:hypothetical protein